MPDLRKILDSASVPDSVKADAWDAWHSTKDRDDFRRRFDTIALPDDTKAALWDEKFQREPIGAGMTGVSKAPDYLGTIPTSLLNKVPGMEKAGYGDVPVYGRQLTSMLPFVGGVLGAAAGTGLGLPTGPGSVAAGTAGATLVGGAGRAAEKLINRSLGWENTPPPETPTGLATGLPAINAEDAKDIALAGAEQGAYEIVGRVFGAAGGRLLTHKPPPPTGETVAGQFMRETAGQKFGKPGGFMQTAEHYLSGTFLGGSLKAVQKAQETATREILARLSQGSPNMLAENWTRAREATRAIASPMYASLRDIEAPQAAQVAKDILSNEDMRMLIGIDNEGSKAQAALSKLTVDPQDIIAQKIGYSNARDALKKLGQRAFDEVMRGDIPTGVTAPGVKIGDAIDARHAIGDLRAHLKNRNDQRLLNEAWHKLNDSIDAALTPEQQAVKQEADKLWRRSYIMERFSKVLEQMENPQAPGEVARVIPKRFAQAVNRMARGPVSRDASGNIVKRKSDLDVLFDDPADRRAMVDLARFLRTKGSTLQGEAGLGEAIARVGATMEAVHVPLAVAMGKTTTAVSMGANLGALYLIARILAEPRGAILMRDYFVGSVGGRTAQAARIGGAVKRAVSWEAPQPETIKNPEEWRTLAPPIPAPPSGSAP